MAQRTSVGNTGSDVIHPPAREGSQVGMAGFTRHRGGKVSYGLADHTGILPVVASGTLA